MNNKLKFNFKIYIFIFFVFLEIVEISMVIIYIYLNIFYENPCQKLNKNIEPNIHLFTIKTYIEHQ